MRANFTLGKGLVSFLLLLFLGACGSEGEGQFSIAEKISIKATPDNINFGVVPVGNSSCVDVFIEHNGSEGTLELYGLTLTSVSTEFALQSPEKTLLEVNEVVTLRVCYTPTDNIQDEAVVVIDHNAIAPTPDVLEIPITTVAQSGALVIIPDPVDFGAVEAGTLAEKNAQLLNAGFDPIQVTGLSWRPDSSPDFSGGLLIDSDGTPLPFPQTLVVGDSTYVRLSYTPTGDDLDIGTLIVKQLASDGSPIENQFSVIASEKGPEIVVSPGVLDLGFVEIATADPVVAPVRVLNKGTAPLVIENIFKALGSNDAMTLSFGPLPIEIPVDGEHLIDVSFHPQIGFGAGTQNIGGVAIDSNDANEPLVTVPVFARENSANLVVTPSDCVDFGFTAMGNTTKRTITLFNGGSAPLKVYSMSFADGTSTDYILEEDMNFGPTLNPPTESTIGPGEAYDVVVSFTNNFGPSGMIPGSLMISSNASPPQNEVSVCLTAKLAQNAECKLNFVPSQTQFGIVALGKKRVMEVKLQNVGSGDCLLPPFSDNDRLRIVDCASFGGFFNFGCTPGSGTVPQQSSTFKALTVPPPSDPANPLGPGEFTTMLVQFTPPSNLSIFGEGFDNHQALIHMKALDPNNGNAPVYAPPESAPGASSVTPNLIAAAGMSSVAVIPQEVDFGVITVGCASPNISVNIYNKGNAPTVINNILLDAGCSSEFELVSSPPLPHTLVQGGPLEVVVRYLPQNTDFDTCSLLIETADPPPLSVPMMGSGTYDEEQTDVFTQISGQDVDVLFVVDNSGSMSDEQNNLGANLSTMVSAASAWNSNYRLAVTTTDVQSDAGAFKGSPRWITLSTPNGVNTFANNVSDIGDNGGGTEEGLEAAYLALTLPNTHLSLDGTGAPIPCSNNNSCSAGGCYADPENIANKYCGGPNWGFLREDASLEVVLISDEEDQSPADLAFYIDFFKNLKGFANEDLIHVHTIVGDTPGGCDSSFGGAESAPRYKEVSTQTGGVSASICAPDYGNILAEIGEVAFGLKKQFFLTRQAQPGTITVTVNGNSCASGWSFDISSNSVIFDEAGNCMPQPGDQISIHYETLCIQP
jgi:hypothetical protein